MNTSKRFTLCAMIAFFANACASFEPALRTADLMRARQPSATESQENLEISIEEFASTQKSQQAFDADVAAYGVLPILFRVENKSGRTFSISQSSIAAFLDGQPLPLLRGEDAANQAATSEYAGKALGWTVAAGPFAILLWPVTIAGSAAHTQSVNRRIQQHFESLQFNDAQLKPNQVATGFFYFKLPAKPKTLERLVVEATPLEQPLGKPLSFKILVPALDLSAPLSR